jgi:hypothetical protein
MLVNRSVTRDACQAQLRQILTSDAFRHTEVLKRLLEYLGQEALGEDRDLKEYTVGVEAFGKPPDYDPRVDSSVRVQAGKLRQKLEEYYRTQGVNDSILVQLPKGRFRLEFRDRSTASDARFPAHPTNVNRFAWALAGIAMIWAVVATVLALRGKGPEPLSERYGNPDVVALWSPFFQSKRPTIISLGTPLFAKIGGNFFRNPGLNTQKSLADSQDVKRIEEQLKSAAVPAYPYTGIGEASAAFELCRLFLSRHKDINLVLSNALTWEDVGRNEVIFLGPPKFNLYESDLPVQQDFLIRHAHLENLHPKPGEPTIFHETWSADQSTLLEGYALIARLPGLHGMGYMMLLASTSTEGTRAAVEYVSRPEYAGELLRSLRQLERGMPKYFEVVIRAEFRSQTPIQIQQVAVHVLRPRASSR